MSRSFGLRFEIVMHLVFLVGAALLMGGFLLLRLGERELVDQRVTDFQAVLQGLGTLPSSQDTSESSLIPRLQEVSRQASFVPGVSGVELWLHRGGMLERIAISGNAAEDTPRLHRIWSPGLATEARIRISYPTMWPMVAADAPFAARIDVPLRLGDQPIGMMRSRLSLQEIADRLHAARRLVFLYAFLYVGVVLLCGVYLLNRHVVRPTARLLSSTMAVAAGNFEERVSEAGPREIAALARAFNAMIAALKKSRQKTEEHIGTLRRTNEELAQTRDELVRSARLATVGHLAAGMAHEIGNPLTAIMGYLALLKSEVSGAGQRELVGRTLSEASRIDQLVRDLLDFAAPASAETEWVDSLEVLREAAGILLQQGKIPPENLEDQLPEALPPVRMVRHHLLQVFINLLINARDASPESCRIRLTAGCEKGQLYLSVSDDGHGIDEKIRPHIFDPFFTTKEPGKGRGLGLSVCYRVVKDAGGSIDVISEAGLGSEFIVRLPVVPSQEG